MATYVCSDIHSNLTYFARIALLLNNPENDLIFLGDAADRGAGDGYAIMNWLLDNEQVLYLKGNHEDMFVKAAIEINEYAEEADLKSKQALANFCAQCDFCRLHVYNGGLDTLWSWIRAGKDMNFVERIDELPLTNTCDYCDGRIYDFCHGSPSIEAWENSTNDLIWGRERDTKPWIDGHILIHGHTPRMHEVIESDFYEKNSRIDIDGGAVFGGTSVIVNLNNWELDVEG